MLHLSHAATTTSSHFDQNDYYYIQVAIDGATTYQDLKNEMLSLRDDIFYQDYFEDIDDNEIKMAIEDVFLPIQGNDLNKVIDDSLQIYDEIEHEYSSESVYMYFKVCTD